MEHVPFKYREAYKLLCRYSDNLHEVIKDGSFFNLSWRERRKLTRRVKRLYNRLSGPVPVSVLKPVVALAGVAALIGCDTGTGGGGDGDDGGPVADNPSFAAPVANPFGIIESPRYDSYGLDLADVDADGDLDLVYVRYGDGRYIEVLFNTGSPTSPDFSSTPLSNPYGVEPYAHSYDEYNTYRDLESITFGDLDNDGDLDAVVIGDYRYDLIEGSDITAEGAVVILNDPIGEGIYFDPYAVSAEDFIETPVESPYSISPFRNQRPELADIDGDGDFDILFSAYDVGPYNEIGAIFVAENTGNASSPSFSTEPQENPFSISFPDGVLPLSIDAVDIDGDGDPDLLLATFNTVENAAAVGWMENTGSATAPSFGSFVENPFGLTSDISSVSSYSLTSGMAVGDIDGDGDLDAFIGFDDVAEGSDSIFFQENENF